jgi:hypothetical protein
MMVAALRRLALALAFQELHSWLKPTLSLMLDLADTTEA